MPRHRSGRLLTGALCLGVIGLLAGAACGGKGAELLPTATTSPSPGTTPGAPASSSPIASGEVTLVAAGDVMLGRSLGDGVRRFGPVYPFEYAADILRAADVTFVNLESPLAEGGQPATKEYVFRGPTQAAVGLAEAGVDIVSLANNHALDYGLPGLEETRAALAAASVAYAGAGENEAAARAPVVAERNGLRLAFLAEVNTPKESGSGFDAAGTVATATRGGVAWATPQAVAADVTAAARQADIVIVSLHSGYEYQDAPNDVQVAVAHAAIDAGATLVLGHHPHVLQGIERYGKGLIVYSLGNFVFDEMPGTAALSVVLRVQLTKEGIRACRLLPIAIDPADGRPHPAIGQEAQAVRERMDHLSAGPCAF